MDFSIENASTLRVINICKLLKKQYETTIVGTGKSDMKTISEIYYRFVSRDGINSKFNKFIRRITYPFLLIRLLNKIPSINAFVFYGLYGYCLFILQAYAKYRHIKTIYDAVEWYEYSHYRFGVLNPSVWQIHWTMVRLIKRCQGIICISSYLLNYYQKCNPNVIFIPPLMEIIESRVEEHELEEDYLNLIYAGKAEKKDLIWCAIEGVMKLKEEGVKIKLYIIGPTEIYSEKHGSLIDDKVIICKGRMSRSDVLKFLHAADFSIIIRDDTKRYAKAGFSTKFVESFSMSLPVIANLTGDMGTYLKNGINGFVIEKPTVEDFCNTIRYVYNKQMGKNKEMKRNAYNTFLDYFELTNYQKPILSYFNSII